MKRKTFLGLLSVILVWLVFPYLSLAEEHLFAWPVSPSHEVVSPYKDEGRYVSGSHRGIDIRAEAGSEIMTAADGIVYWHGKTPRGEPYVSVQHEGGLRTTYMPVEIKVKRGQTVKQGETIGILSSAVENPSSFSHLHFGVKKEPYESFDYMDPLSLLPSISLRPEQDPEHAKSLLTSDNDEEVLPLPEEEINPVTESLKQEVPYIPEESLPARISKGTFYDTNDIRKQQSRLTENLPDRMSSAEEFDSAPATISSVPGTAVELPPKVFPSYFKVNRPTDSYRANTLFTSAENPKPPLLADAEKGPLDAQTEAGSSLDFSGAQIHTRVIPENVIYNGKVANPKALITPQFGDFRRAQEKYHQLSLAIEPAQDALSHSVSTFLGNLSSRKKELPTFPWRKVIILPFSLAVIFIIFFRRQIFCWWFPQSVNESFLSSV